MPAFIACRVKFMRKSVAPEKSKKLLTITTDDSGDTSLQGFNVYLNVRGARTLIGQSSSEFNWSAEYSGEVWVTCCCDKNGNFQPYFKGIRNQSIDLKSNVTTEVTGANGHNGFEFTSFFSERTLNPDDIFENTPCDAN